MNTASRMESTGESGRIQLSEDTAMLLAEAGKAKWIEKREGTVDVKGKGVMQTYWLTVKKTSHQSRRTIDTASVATSQEDPGTEVALSVVEDPDDLQENRLVEWNTEMLLSILTQIITQRKNKGESQIIHHSTVNRKIPMDEVSDFIEFPPLKPDDFNSSNPTHANKYDDVPEAAITQLRRYVALIAGKYYRSTQKNLTTLIRTWRRRM